MTSSADKIKVTKKTAHRLMDLLYICDRVPWDRSPMVSTCERGSNDTPYIYFTVTWRQTPTAGNQLMLRQHRQYYLSLVHLRVRWKLSNKNSLPWEIYFLKDIKFHMAHVNETKLLDSVASLTALPLWQQAIHLGTRPYDKEPTVANDFTRLESTRNLTTTL